MAMSSLSIFVHCIWHQPYALRLNKDIPLEQLPTANVWFLNCVEILEEKGHLGCTPTSCVSYVKLRNLCVLCVLCELLFAVLIPQKWSRVTLVTLCGFGQKERMPNRSQQIWPTNLGRGRIPPLGNAKIKNIIIGGQSYIGPQTFLFIIPTRIANV